MNLSIKINLTMKNSEKTVTSRITSINRKAADEWFHKAHSEDGITFLSSTSPATTAEYYGFVVTTAEATVSSITLLDPSKVSGDITVMSFGQGYYSIPGGFSTITLATGNVILLREA